MRDELWTKAVKRAKKDGAVLQIWTDQNPQGFSYRQAGQRERRFVDFEGLALVQFKQTQETRQANFADTGNTS